MIVSGEIGLVHLTAAIMALITGTWILAANKGTLIHRAVGYVYIVSMLMMLVTAFMIYRLFGGFGIFHVFAVISSITLLGGMIPAIRRKPEKSWLDWHFSFMYWSVLGLYGAFVGEILVRIPATRSFRLLGVSIMAVMALGYLFFFFYKKRWAKFSAIYTGENELLLADKERAQKLN